MRRLSRWIGVTSPFVDVVESEIHPGSDVVDDPSAVVDPSGAVRGVRGLHVVDASIMPDIPSAPTNLTTIMIAEAISPHLAHL